MIFKDFRIIDISWPISPTMTAYKDRKIVQFTQTKIFQRDGAREAMIQLGTHTGTHVDAPAHFLQEGKTVDALNLEQLIGPCQVLDLSQCHEKITLTDVQNLELHAGSIVLFKTKNSLLKLDDLFNAQFVYLDAAAATFLAEKKVKAVGIDYLGIERNQPAHETHVALLEKNIPIIEGLRLKDVMAGSYFFCCLPLLLQGLDGAPARAVLMI